MQEKKEFDLLVKLMKIFDKDEANYELLIKDLSNKPWTMIVNKLKFNDFKEGEIYRIRGVYTEQNADKRVIIAKNTTNFLKFRKNSLIYRELQIGVREDADEEDPNEVLLYPKLGTQIKGDCYDYLQRSNIFGGEQGPSQLH